MPDQVKLKTLTKCETLTLVVAGIGVDRKPIWEIVEEVNAGLPADTWDDVSTDGSINLDHYLYGAPKQQP